MSRPQSPEDNLITIREIKGLIDALEELIQDTSNESASGNSLENINAFSVGKIPKINIEDYFSRIIKYSKLQIGSFIAMMIYLDKAAEKLDITFYNIHRLILGALICAIKYTCDISQNNHFFAKVGGISYHEVCLLESTFLVLIDYRLYISDDEYQKYLSFIRQ